CLINSADPTGDTALHLAVRYHNKLYFGSPCPKKARKRLRETDFNGLESLLLATGSTELRPHDSILALVGNYEDEMTYGEKLHGLVKMLLYAGTDVDATDVNGCSPQHSHQRWCRLRQPESPRCHTLHDAILCGSEEVLLTHGARVDIEIENQSDTALHWALHLSTDNSHREVIILAHALAYAARNQ
ncbi:hypothetical protein TSAR_015597, partial [Trichomalopsis sarcophagae]